MPRRSSLRVRRMNVAAFRRRDAVYELPSVTFKQAARMIRATRPHDAIELIEADLRAGQQLTADGVLYFADVVDTLPKEPNR